MIRWSVGACGIGERCGDVLFKDVGEVFQNLRLGRALCHHFNEVGDPHPCALDAGSPAANAWIGGYPGEKVGVPRRCMRRRHLVELGAEHVDADCLAWHAVPSARESSLSAFRKLATERRAEVHGLEPVSQPLSVRPPLRVAVYRKVAGGVVFVVSRRTCCGRISIGLRREPHTNRARVSRAPEALCSSRTRMQIAECWRPPPPPIRQGLGPLHGHLRKSTSMI